MKTRLILASLAILAAGCSRDGSSDDGGSKETAVEVASRPFTIGDEVADQMGTHVGDMGTDRDGDPALNVMAAESQIPVGAAPASPIEGGSDGAASSNSQFTTEGGPEG